ncbi:TraR/DksA family transcriptional regulator [Coraliomargarita akajimensis]|uniref:Transcriptional regulator, TraR/DksA family n=1 Tax=Coraliomargarita akajimensis (strain DSM 45221 / IAM 15411 / JCM 23193 / KCTC 12865 / 04OKA010-24) TaxID=583355 RepID=D5EQU0_CORAD|nr:TraR/DksA C4-type zinc finger protein [Coraliomargarita akajimensis]ADE53933.1 transcriptional regulator, TraR/DksA family [Coraliomargarita akajimensis DSM 45221]
MTKKKTPAKKKATKTAAKKKAPAKKTAAKKAGGLKKASVARSGTADAGDKKATPIVFSMDDVEALMATKKKESKSTDSTKKATAAVKKPKVVDVTDEDKPTEKRVLGAASLSDILGFNPAEKKKETTLEEDSIPKKWHKYYKLLLELRTHVKDELDLHTADTLKHASSEDAGDLAHYGNHQADAGTDTFDRDFALSLVSSEQDALNEIEEAIMRMKDGSYGVCEVTGEPINKERLVAVPFARFSLEGQKEFEKNNRRKVVREAGGLFGDSTDAPKIVTDEDE